MSESLQRISESLFSIRNGGKNNRPARIVVSKFVKEELHSRPSILGIPCEYEGLAWETLAEVYRSDRSMILSIRRKSS